jgi:hypothetical protein
MAKKLHLTKLEEVETEVGVQLRDSNPPTGLENRIFINRNTGELRAFINGQDVHLSFNLYEVDPQNPVEKQVWVNTTGKQLKWKLGGVVQSVSLEGGLKVGSQRSTSEYISTLTQVELEQIADISTALPNYLVDAFQKTVENSVLVDLEERGSTLRVQDGLNTGTYDLERRVSPAYNYTEGIAVIKSQALTPKTVTDNNDGTHELVFQSDVTDILWNGAEMLGYEQEVDELENINAYYALDGDLNPARFIVSGVSYDAINDETTATFTDSGLDLTLGFSPSEYAEKLRFKPINLKVEASADGSLGVMTELEPVEVEGLSGLSAVLGQELFTKISTQLSFENVLYHRVVHSPSRQYYVLQIWCTTGDTGRQNATSHIWYSNDNLKTINYMSDWVGFTTAPTVDTSENAQTKQQNWGYRKVFSPKKMKINDDGRYVFTYWYVDPSNTSADLVYFGDLTRPNPNPILANGNFGGYAGTVAFEQNSTYAYEVDSVEVDWEMNLAFICMARTNEDGYIQMWEIDWANNNTYARSYYGLGTDHRQTAIPVVSFIKEFEGERQYFVLYEHGTNRYKYAVKWRYKRQLDEYEAGIYLNHGFRGDVGNVSSDTSPTDGDRYAGGAFSNSLEGGNRYETNSYIHTWASNSVHDFGWDMDDDTLILLHFDDDDFNMQLSGINFGRTTYGAPPAIDLAFDAVPDNGNFTLDVTDVLSSTTETTSPIPFSADVSQITSILEAITFIGAGNVEVTGDFASGFEIRLSLFRRQEMNFVINTNSLLNSATPVNITLTTVEAGFQPVWLRHTRTSSERNNELYNPANGLFIELDTAIRGFSQRYSGDATLTDWNLDAQHGQGLWVRGKTVLMHTMTLETNNAHDGTRASIIKIPDYTQCYGSGFDGERIVWPGSDANAFIRHRNNPDIVNDDTGTRIAQKFNSGTNPYGMYVDGKIHLRTMLLYTYQSWQGVANSRQRRPTRPSDQMRIRILPLGVGGTPDWDNPIAISKGFPINHLPPNADKKWTPFIFDNVKLEPNTDYFLGIEVVGLNMESIIPENSENEFIFLFGARDLTTANTCFMYKPDQGGWVSANEEIWFKFYDYYHSFTPINHESGPNTDTYQYRINWVDGPQFYETTIHPIGDEDTSKTYLASYRYNQGYFANDNNVYSNQHGGSHVHVFEIDDSGDPEAFPIIRDSEILGFEGANADSWDRNLVFAFVNGRDDEFSPARNTDGTFLLNSSDERDKEYNYNSHFGGFRMNEDANICRRKEFSGLDYGMEDDPDFRYGTCCHYNLSGGQYIYNHSLDMTPWQNDFIWECEVKPTEVDLDGSDNIMFGSNQLWYAGFRLSRLHFYSYYNGTFKYTHSDELLEDRYQRVRITRDWDNGIRMFRNYSAIGGTWEELGTTSIDGGETGDFWKHGVCIGDSDYNRLYFSIGRWTESASFNMDGRIGYMKLAIGKPEFAYDGVNFEQRSRYQTQNTGDNIFALKTLSAGDVNNDQRMMANYGIYKHNVNSAKVRSNFTVLKYKNTIAGGRNMASKLTLYKASDNDPSAVEGYLLSFFKK